MTSDAAESTPAHRVGTKHALREAWSASLDDYVTALSLSADGSLAALGTGAGDVCILHTESGQVQSRVLAHEGGVLALEWSPKARVLASAGQDGLARLHTAEGASVAELPGSAWVEHVAWSPDGKRLATAAGRIVRIWTASGAAELETEPHESTVTGIAWNRRGTELATACYGGVQLFSVASGAFARRLPWRGSLISLARSPNDAVIACGTQESSVHIWRLASGRDSEMSGFPAKPRALAWSSDSALLATGGDTTVTVWSFEGKGPEGKAPTLLVGHQALCTTLAFHPKQARLASGSDDTGVLVWDPRTSTSPLGFGFLEETATALGWTSGGKLLIGADAVGTVRAWRFG